jgi:hypothetical protein
MIYYHLREGKSFFNDFVFEFRLLWLSLWILGAKISMR